jgi:hypothetical protein
MTMDVEFIDEIASFGLVATAAHGLEIVQFVGAATRLSQDMILSHQNQVACTILRVQVEVRSLSEVPGLGMQRTPGAVLDEAEGLHLGNATLVSLQEPDSTSPTAPHALLTALETLQSSAAHLDVVDARG